MRKIKGRFFGTAHTSQLSNDLGFIEYARNLVGMTSKDTGAKNDAAIEAYD